ncbi:helix-turn-helix domain-containing protein [Pseudomonas sp. App30]|uniref:helix-turn-helix domain-containing protein n=1 Tax=Pseudomonas sp. App30 TaxID=3068990 RepID=UPI003A8109BF
MKVSVTHHNGAQSGGYHDCLRAAKHDIVSGVTVTDPVIAQYLRNSWKRSYELGIHPEDRRLSRHDHPLFVIDDDDRLFSAIVDQEINAIWESFGGEHWAVYCTNAKAVIVRARHGSNPRARAFALHVGRRIQECDVGTTAPACVLHEKVAITLVGAEHYLNEFADMFCCAVPVWGPWGTLIGVLNVTGSETFKSRLVVHKLQSAAIKIENRLFLAAHDMNLVFKIHHDADFINTHLAGLVAVNAFGDVLSATRNALEMFAPIDPLGKRINVAELFVDGFIATQGYCQKTSLRNGIVFYTQACIGEASHALIEDVAVTRNASLRERADLHILDIVRQCGGNISKAARVLGLSRTTLYRTLNRKAGD